MTIAEIAKRLRELMGEMLTEIEAFYEDESNSLAHTENMRGIHGRGHDLASALEDHGPSLGGANSVGFSFAGMDSGEAGLLLDVNGHTGTVYVSREMWEAVADKAGWRIA